MTISGRRLADSTWPDVLPVALDNFRDGDYWKCLGTPRGDHWFVYYRGAAGIPLHHVEEHEDGTITVEPGPWGSNSIAISSTDAAGQPVELFHGYIRRGVWERC